MLYEPIILLLSLNSNIVFVLKQFLWLILKVNTSQVEQNTLRG